MLKYSWNIFGKSILETETNTKVGIQKFRLNYYALRKKLLIIDIFILTFC